jgi:spermidine/putrescine transport system permease protein
MQSPLKAGRLKNFLLVLVVAPFFVSFLLRTVAWKQILGEEGFVVPGLRTLGIISESTTLTSTSFAVVMGMTYNFLPFMTLPLYASLERIDPRTMEASGDLYANGFDYLPKGNPASINARSCCRNAVDLYSRSR